MSSNRRSNQKQNAKVAATLTYSLLFLTLKPGVIKELAVNEDREKQQTKAEIKALREQVKFEQKQLERQVNQQQKPPQHHHNSHYTKRR